MKPSTAPFSGAVIARIGGACGLCGAAHWLDYDAAPALAALSRWWTALSSPTTEADRAFLALLARGGGRKMLATLVGRDACGATVTLRAFSGDLGGASDVAGCVPSVIRREDTAALENETLQIVAQATARLTSCDPAVRDLARRERRQASAALMAAMIDATRLRTRGGRRVPLRDAFVGARAGRGIPSGTADCALPKLLDAAWALRLEVVSAAEASWAPGVVDGERAHGALAAPCDLRCAPLLGAMLCPTGPTGPIGLTGPTGGAPA
ncbi:MAG: hypothetical protein FJ137_05135 [Deltaproteobacteria bacterium]|nr:hypothetical protein [Deltaproteobacteria bacterium]